MELKVELSTEQQFRLRSFEMELQNSDLPPLKLKRLLLESVRQNLLYQGIIRQCLTAQLRGEVATAVGKDLMSAPVEEGGFEHEWD